MSVIKKLTETVIGDLGDKRRWREYKRRAKALPEPYRTTVRAIERYLMHLGGISRGDLVVTMVGDLADLFETAAADGTPVRDVVGDDPVEFVETFLANYDEDSWRAKERERLVRTIDQAERGEYGDDDHD